MLLMLEDNAERIERFTAVLNRIAPELELRIWRDAWKMLEEMKPLLPSALLISLDHDLDPEFDDSPDPGTGWELTQVLAEIKPCCPVIIHTSNGERATWMRGEFDLGGWNNYRIVPIGDDWIENDWARLVRRLLRRKKKA